MYYEVQSDFAKANSAGSSEKVVQSTVKSAACATDYILGENHYRSSVYEQTFKRSIENPEEFWAEVGQCIEWSKPWEKVLDNSEEPFTKWFVGGETNACYNALDRHVASGLGSKVALIHDSPSSQTIRKVTYAELLDKVSSMAGVMSKLGVRKGDRVLIYMPLIPETVVAMLACARLGAIHSVVFGGFAAKELVTRINHAEPKIVLAASCGLEPNKIVRYTDMLNEALNQAKVKTIPCIIYQRRNIWTAPLLENQFDWENLMKTAKPHPCVSVEANEPVYILYTSGTTGNPKGVQRPLAGHIATLCWSMKVIYGLDKNSVWWTTSDLGWALGTSYTCYAPLLYGCTSVMYEGKPDKTPDAAQYFRIIDQHKVNGMCTVPSAMRVLKRADSESRLGKKYSLKSLKSIYTAGEYCDYETKAWIESTFRVPVLNHWWQTESGHPITATCLGLGHSINPPKYAAGMPFPGYNVKVLRYEDGSEASANELGRIALKLPLPPGNLSTLYREPERFKEAYFKRYPGYYDTMDAGYIDEFGYVYVTARDDDVIKVAGIRLSTSTLEDVVLGHSDVVDAAVIGVPEATKGEVPLCLYVVSDTSSKNEEEISAELVDRVRKFIGPIASFKLSAAVKALPRTRTSKICRKSIADLARSKHIKIPSTIDDASVFTDIIAVLKKLGYAQTVPDPE